MLGVVVRSADCIALAMRELTLDGVAIPATFARNRLNLAQDGDCLGGEGHDVLLSRLHARGSNAPLASLEVDL